MKSGMVHNVGKEAQVRDCAKSILGIFVTLRDILLPWIFRLELDISTP